MASGATPGSSSRGPSCCGVEAVVVVVAVKPAAQKEEPAGLSEDPSASPSAGRRFVVRL